MRLMTIIVGNSNVCCLTFLVQASSSSTSMKWKLITKKVSKKVHEVKKVKCWQCDVICSTKPSLAKHLRFVHDTKNECADKEETEKCYKCGICGNISASQKELILHLAKVHDKVSIIECNKCAFTTSD